MTVEKCSARQVKCVVWDLDETLFEGVLLEGGAVRLRNGVVGVVKELDRRGILQSIASRNDHAQAMERLESFGIAEYFLCPQIHFGNKSESVRIIAETLNIGIDTLAFVDDQEFERDEVNSVFPEVYCIDAADIGAIIGDARMVPRFVTEDSENRRRMYLDDMERLVAEERFDGPREEFLAGLNMRFTIHLSHRDDLKRAVELTERTNQLNTTGCTFGYDELDELRTSPRHLLYVCSLDDRYGNYGRIGLSLVEKGDSAWTIRLLLMSCRVMNRGVGALLLNHIIRKARESRMKLRADFFETGRNRMMYVTYRFAGMQEIERNGASCLLDLPDDVPLPGFPNYIEVLTDD